MGVVIENIVILYQFVSCFSVEIFENSMDLCKNTSEVLDVKEIVRFCAILPTYP